LGMALAFGLSGYLLNATGFDVEMGGAQTASTFFWMRVFDVLIPAVAAALSIWAVASFKITEEKSAEIREQLDARHKKAEAAPAAAS
ncbi:MAG: MFS transporter, partial [Calditrichaeota bacterium]|nr:MFS transporter [Calditrichota bacterium]